MLLKCVFFMVVCLMWLRDLVSVPYFLDVLLNINIPIVTILVF